MGTRNFLVLKTQFDLLHKALLNRVLYGNMVGVVGSIFARVFCVIGFIARYIFRLLGNDQRGYKSLGCTDIGEREVDFGGENERKEESESCENLETRCCSVSSTNKYEFFSLKDINGFVEEPKALSFTVQELYLGSNESAIIPHSQIPESTTKVSSEEAEDFVRQEEELSEKPIALCQILFSENDIIGCLEEPKALSFTVEESAIPDDNETQEQDDDHAEDSVTQEGELLEKSKAFNQNLFSENDINGDLDEPKALSFKIPNNQIVEIREQDDHAEDFVTKEHEKPKELFPGNDITGDSDETKALSFTIPDNQIVETREQDDQAEDFVTQEQENSKELFPGNDITGDSDETKAPSFTIPDNQIVETREQDDQAEDFVTQEQENSKELFPGNDITGDSDETKAPSFTIPDNKIVETREQDDQAEDFATERNEPKLMMADSPESSFLGKADSSSQESDSQLENHSSPCDANSAPNSISPSKDDSSIIYEFDQQHHNDSEDEYIELEPKEEKMKPELEWEHEDVIEQLKLELRNARTGGLPTIMEEESVSEYSDSDSPSAEEGHVALVMPVRVDLSVKFGYKEIMEEVQKVYKIYAEKMRKLDILNSQTMHALGFLQLKDQFKPTQKQKKTILPRKAQKDNDPSLKYAEKLQNDFELVYVGQLCLSWEILSWQHRRLRDHLLLQNDAAQPHRHYNLVASEFQLFQVLVQRFVEDESFQGPRVHNYAKTRCVVRSLLQVPLVRDDCAKDKRYVVEGSESVVFCEGLDRVIVEAMFAFWEFVRKDNEKSNANVRFSQQSVSEPGDSKLLVDIKREFHKKDRKVKDIQRSGNCVVKKLQKNQQEIGFQHALLLAQIELRLVSRVLSMSRSLTRDQLIWCQQKLNQISFSKRKVHMETSFLLFPC